MKRMRFIYLFAWIVFVVSAVCAAPGDIDPTFNAGAVTRDGLSTQVSAIVPLPDGRTLIGGQFDSVGGTPRNFIARLNSDGTVDTTFNAPLLRFVNGISGNVTAIALQPDGQILVAGSFRVGVDNKVIVRLNQDGSIDSTFNSDGAGNFAYRIVLQPDGKIIVGGQLGNFGGVQSRGLVRLNPNGSLDVSLGLTADIAGDTFAIALQPDGKIIVGGSLIVLGTTPTQQNLVRLNANGTRDASFAVGTGPNNTVFGLAVQPDGKIVAGGLFTSIGTTARSAIARLNSDGSVDGSFNPTIVGGGGLQGIMLQSKGRILAFGAVGVINGQTRSGIARFSSTGALDAFYPTGGAVNNIVFAAAYQKCSKLFIGGTFTSVGGLARAHVARLTDAASKSLADFEGDGCSDLSVFRPADGVWHWLRSSDNAYNAARWGISTDKLAPADYDGDGRADIAVWREAPALQAAFYILNSSNSTVRVEPFGQTGDVAVAGDFDGDGKSDVAVYRGGAQSSFFYRASLNNPNGNTTFVPWGAAGDVPAIGDYDGDGKADATVFRPSAGTWFTLRSSTNSLATTAFGGAGDKLVPDDYDGDGLTDVAVYRGGVWWIAQSASGGALRVTSWGTPSDTPVAADYDGDGRADVAIYRGGAWWILNSASGALTVGSFGLATDAPVEAAFVR